MAELRHSLRALALAGHPPAEVIANLDRLLALSFPGMTSTLCIAVIHRDGEVAVTNAGHMTPVVAYDDGARFVETHGVLLGVREAHSTPTETVPFPVGARLVMATDGLIERRREPIGRGLERFRSAVQAHRGTLDDLTDHLLTDVGAGQVGLDDVAIVAARHR
jgi:serine phosphatase RsbU (regulator of sigma subunit)